MTLWPTLITGLVGVAGITGTILAARMTARAQTANLMLSINKDRERVQLADKRQVYANFISSMHDIILTAIVVRYSETDPQKKLKALINALPAQGVIYNRLGELELIAPEEVISQARAFVKFIMGFVHEILENANALEEEKLDLADTQMEKMEKELSEIMRTDLGIESVSSVHQLKADQLPKRSAISADNDTISRLPPKLLAHKPHEFVLPTVD
jgi:hypothetical protein